MKDFFACVSSEHKWCGFAHRSKDQAERCQYLQKSKFGEVRETHVVRASADKRAKEICEQSFGILPEVHKRVDEFRNNMAAKYHEKKQSQKKQKPLQQVQETKDLPEVELLKKEIEAYKIANKLENPSFPKVSIENSEEHVQKKAKSRPHADKHEKQDLLISLVEKGCNVLLKGPAGSGKTYVAKLAAKILEKDFYMMPALADKFEVMGFVRPDGGFQETQYYQWAANPKGGVLLLDEFDGSYPQAALALNAGIARGGIVTFPNNENFEITDNHIVIAAANTFGLGPSADYCGRNKLDAATLDRFEAIIDWDYDKKLERGIALNNHPESDKEKILDFCDRAHQIREKIQQYGIQTIFATRSLLAFVKLRDAGFTEQEALEVSKLATLDEKQRRQIVAV